MPKRCALGCPPLGVPTHIFPHPERFPATFKAWVDILGGKLENPEDYKKFRKMIICDIHFTDKDKNRNNRLNALAVPTLFLPARPLEHIPPASSDLTNIRRAPLKPIENIEQPLEHISQASSDITNVRRAALTPIENIRDHPVKFSEQHLIFARPSTSTEITDQPVSTPVLDVIPSSSTVVNLTESSPVPNRKDTQSIFMEHNYCKQEKAELRPCRSARNHPKRASYKIYDHKLKALKTKIKILTSKQHDFKTRLENAKRISQDVAFKKVTRNMTAASKLFTGIQSSQTKKKPSGRRYSLEEKILSLTIYKKSTKVYNFLSKLFTLPSVKTIRSVLAKIKIGSGLIDVIFDKMKETIKNMTLEEKLCTLMFDEMALTPQIHYDRAHDKLKGFADSSSKKIADHVLVFMIKGVKANYKQPVAYYFTNTVKKLQLKNLIKEVIKKLQDTGLIVLCTVCDQGSANVGAINELIEETKTDYIKKGKDWQHDFFEVQKRQIIPLFDVPHLIKGLRNNLLNKDLVYIDFDDNNNQKIVKWEYFQQVSQADKCLGELRCLHKLTEEHLNPEKIKKMRVKNAAQIFSHSVAVVTEHLSARKLVGEECRQLIPIVGLIDKLFDSLNSATLHIPDGKIYKGCVRKNSPHHQLWQKALRVLKTMKFITKKKTNDDKFRLVETVTPTIKNFIKTIEGMHVLWTTLSKKYLFDCMLTRHFNQDPLENFFGSIRSYGVRNVAPNCVSFEGAYKSLLLNNFSSTHSLQANCEKDSYNCLQNLDFFLQEDIVTSDASEEINEITLNEDVLIDSVENDLGQRNYVCGWVLTKCLKNVVKGCKICKNELLSNKNERPSNEYIQRREYNKNKQWLVYPSGNCERAFEEIQQITVSVLKKDVPESNLKKKIKIMVDTLVYFQGTCTLHFDNFKHLFEDVIINVLIYSWCRSINRILAGKMSYDGEDETKTIAQGYYNKHKHNKLKK